jgi:hypothetical protein
MKEQDLWTINNFCAQQVRSEKETLQWLMSSVASCDNVMVKNESQ